jgi:hypothetical protein
MTQSLDPVDDLNWSAERAREFGNEIVALWSEWLARLPELAVAGRATAAEVRAAVTRDVPDEPLPTDELLATLRTIASDHPTLVGPPGFMA